LQQILTALPGRAPRDEKLQQQIRDGHATVWQQWQTQEQGRVSPPRLLRALQARFGKNTIFTADSGNGLFLGVECLRLDGPRQFLAPVDYSCMGYAIPAAIGAKLGQPDATVVALAGDGALLMTGLEMLTAATLNLPIIIVVLRDRELAQIAQFQQTALSRKTASEIGDYDVATLFAALGVESLRLDHNDQIDACLHDAGRIVAGGRPVVIDVAIDYSQKTYFTKGVVKTNLLRLPWNDRLRFVGRAMFRLVQSRFARNK
jgi:acetolactate synthase-1/2/3 large subunit